MKLIQNRGADRAVDLLRPHLKAGQSMALMTPTFSLHAYAELRDALVRVSRTQLILPGEGQDLEIQGGEGDRAARNRLQTRWLANQCAAWLQGQVEVRRAPGRIPQGTAVLRNAQGTPEQVIMGSVAMSTEGLNQSLAEATLRVGQSTRTHYHPKAEEIYYILRGEGRMKIGEEERRVGPGDAIAIPAGTLHQIRHQGQEELVFLCCCAPGYEPDDVVFTG